MLRFLAHNRGFRVASLALALALSLRVEGLIAATIYETDSVYHRIRVEDNERIRYLLFDRTVQSGVDLDAPDSLLLRYARFASLGLTLKPGPKKVLIIGLGGGSIPKKYHTEFPSMEIDVAEIDPEVIKVAKRFFFFQEAKNLRVYPQDGRLHITRTDQRYDLILLDAYAVDTVPFHLTTREFFRAADQKIAPKGVMVVNIIGAVTGTGSKIVRSLVKTLSQSFPQIYVFPTLGTTDADIRQNVIILAGKDQDRVSIEEIMKRAASLGRDLFPKRRRDIVDAYYAAPIPTNDVPMLTDDYAPTDSLLYHGSPPAK